MKRSYISIGLSVILLIAVGVAIYFSARDALQSDESAEAPVAETDVVVTRSSQSEEDLQSPDPLFGPNYDASSELPTYICGADAFGSYFVLQQMQMSGLDVENGFHLGIVPFLLDEDPAYDVSEELRTGLLDQGKWDCLLTTLDSVALSSPGVITAIVDESAGADQLWARDISNLNDLRGKRIAFSRGSVGEYFVYYALSIARLNPRFDVTLVPTDSVAEAVEAFNDGRADAVSAWEPDIYDAETGGGVPLLSTGQLRVVMDVVVTSRQSIDNRADLVQSFHDAWFATLKNQLDNFDGAASDIADWGHNDWSFVYPETASEDLTLWLESVAQADLGDNIFVMRETTPLINRLEIARRVWATSGAPVSNVGVEELVNPGFVSRAGNQASLQSNSAPINDTFSVNAAVTITDLNTADAATLAVLPCRRFTFLPESTELTLESRRILDDCVLPTLSQSIGLYLQVKGSSAWPGPAGTFTEDEILEFAEARAQSVVDYLVSQGIDPARFVVNATLPPEANWETEDPLVQAEDRFVEMTLVTVGR
ncbi:MAG: transporter substrate-binding domain-containing protein [Ardenticatenaceae bacterium]|nr:transporter substrate-binding domain-containing protein [Ardenticatenaceae bacterium]